MRYALLLCLTAVLYASEEDAVYRLESFRMAGKDEVTGHGNAVAVDLSEYGLAGKHHLLTAAHLLSGYEKSWIVDGKEQRACKTIWVDEGLDVAVVSVDAELSETVSLGDHELAEKTKPLWIAYHYAPDGIKRASQEGLILSKQKLGWLVELKGFAHGSSGSPLFKDGKVAGLVLSVPKIGKDELADRGVALSLRYVRMFLLYESKRRKE